MVSITIKSKAIKTAEETLRDKFCESEWDEFMEHIGVDITPSVVRAIEEYATERVKEAVTLALQTAADNALLEYDDMPYSNAIGVCKKSILSLEQEVISKLNVKS